MIATCKHYAANDFDNTTDVTRYGFDAKISTQDLSEYYLPPFKTCAVEQDVGAFMCSYNGINGTPLCANQYLLQDILRNHWDWNQDEHYIVTDCTVVQYMVTEHEWTNNVANASALAMRAGTDLQCNGAAMDGLWAAWNESLIDEGDIDKSLTRLYSALVSVGLFDPSEDQPLRDLSWEDVNTEEARDLAYQIAVEGPVLIKNDRGTLPLSTSSNKTVAVIGPLYNATRALRGNYAGPAPSYISPVQAARDLGLNVKFGLGSGITTGNSSAYDEGMSAAKAADLIIFHGGLDNSVETEAHDRSDIAWPKIQTDFIDDLAKLDKPLVIVQLGGGQVDDTELLANDAVDAILWAGYPGQAGGKAIFDLLYGKVAPAGRLPVTQYPASYGDAVPPTDMDLRPAPGNSDLGRTYLWYNGETPVPFGFGLHYTDFEVTIEDKVKWEGNGKKGDEMTTTAVINSAGSDLTWQKMLELPVLTVPVTVENTGSVTSDYVALLFMRSNAGPSPHPLKTLVAYHRFKSIEPGTTLSEDLVVTVERLVRVDEEGNRVLYPGDYELFVDIDESASLDFSLKGEHVVIENFPQPQ